MSNTSERLSTKVRNLMPDSTLVERYKTGMMGPACQASSPSCATLRALNISSNESNNYIVGKSLETTKNMVILIHPQSAENGMGSKHTFRTL